MSLEITHSLVQALRNVPGFDTQDDTTLLAIVGASANLFWSGGSTVFAKGEPAEALYIVLSGQARVYDVRDGQHTAIEVFEPGDYFGEYSLVLHASHSRHAEVTRDAELMVIPREAFEPLLAGNPDLAAHFREKVEARRIERAAKAPPST